MPLVCKLDPANSLVIAVANGDVTRLEMDQYLDVVVACKALAYRKVFDVHRGDTSMTGEDVLPLAVRMRSLHELGPMGPLAVVLPAGRGKRLQRALGMLAMADRPMRVFENPILAYRWLAKQDVASAADGDREAKRTPEESAKESGKARDLAARIRHLARTANEEARVARVRPRAEDLVYRGNADIVHRGVPLNICVKKVGQGWEFRCCGADRKTLGTLLTLAAEEIAASRLQGRSPLAVTLDRIKTLAQAGQLAIPDTPTGAY